MTPCQSRPCTKPLAAGPCIPCWPCSISSGVPYALRRIYTTAPIPSPRGTHPAFAAMNHILVKHTSPHAAARTGCRRGRSFLFRFSERWPPPAQCFSPSTAHGSRPTRRASSGSSTRAMFLPVNRPWIGPIAPAHAVGKALPAGCTPAPVPNRQQHYTLNIGEGRRRAPPPIPDRRACPCAVFSAIPAVRSAAPFRRTPCPIATRPPHMPHWEPRTR